MHLQQDMKWMKVSWVESSVESSWVELKWVCVFTIYDGKCLCLPFSTLSIFLFKNFLSFFSRSSDSLSLSLLFMYVVIKLYFQLNQMKCDRKDTIIEISMSASHTESESERERDRGRCNTTNVIGPNGKWEFYYVNIYSHTNSKLCVHISY